MLKSLPKILIIFFLAIFIFQLSSLIFLFTLPQASQAATASFQPQVGIGTDFQTGKSYSPDGNTRIIGEYIRAIYKYAIGIVGILAAVVLMIGGILWIVAGGNATTIGEAKAWIGASLTGLVLALMSYLILATVNPALVDLKTVNLKKVSETINGCCIYTSGEGQIVSDISNLECSRNKGTFYKDKFAQNGKCITESERVGCCVVSFRTGAALIANNKYCYKNFKSSECSLSGSILNLPEGAKQIGFNFDSRMNGLCDFYLQGATGCQAKN